MAARSPTQEKAVTWAGLSHLIVVYLIWGSTYLAIRLTVREQAGFPPFTVVAMRVVTAGVLLMLWSAAARLKLRVRRDELITLAGSGILLWLGGNGLVTWGEQRADSGYAALLIGASPIWVALIESLLDRKIPSPLLIGSLVVGFGGIALLSVPVLREATPADSLSVLALILAALCWSSGTVLQSRRPVTAPSRVSSGYQHLFGGAALILVALARGEPAPDPSPEAWWALGYLIVFGSIIAFTSFVQALRLLPTPVVMTYAYVNPVIAVVLGFFILGEPITTWTLAGAPLVFLGVAGVFRERSRRARAPAPRKLPVVGETGG
ncbi:MAG TPA: EamA family transporter [Anaerolineales bacterium]